MLAATLAGMAVGNLEDAGPNPIRPPFDASRIVRRDAATGHAIDAAADAFLAVCALVAGNDHVAVVAADSLQAALDRLP